MSEQGQMDISTQRETFKAFVNLFKYGTIGIVILLILMAIFLV